MYRKLSYASLAAVVFAYIFGYFLFDSFTDDSSASFNFLFFLPIAIALFSVLAALAAWAEEQMTGRNVIGVLLLALFLVGLSFWLLAIFSSGMLCSGPPCTYRFQMQDYIALTSLAVFLAGGVSGLVYREGKLSRLMDITIMLSILPVLAAGLFLLRVFL